MLFRSQPLRHQGSPGLLFKVLLILASAPDHPETYEFNPNGIKVVYLPPNTMSLIQPLDQGVIRTCNAHYIWCPMERIDNTMEENPDRENIMEVWKDYTSEDAILVIKKRHESH